MNSRRVIYLLLLGVAALSPWGDVQRVATDTAEGAGPGITTLLGLAAIACGMASGRTLAGMRAYPASVLFAAFLFLVGTVSVHNTESMGNVLALGAYCLLAFTVSGVDLTQREVARVLGTFALSAALVCLLAIADHFEYVDVPGFARRPGRVEYDAYGIVAYNLVGPFGTRTGLAVQLAMAFPVALWFTFLPTQRVARRMLWLLAAAVIAYAGIQSFSRAFLMSMAAVFVYSIHQTASATRLRRAIGLALVCACGAFAFHWLAPDPAQVVQLRATSVHPVQLLSGEGRNVRRDALIQTWDDLGDSPLGLGFTRTSVSYRRDVNVHSNPTAILRAGGPLGLLLVFFFFWPVLKRALRRQRRGLESAVLCTLLSFSVYGLSHMTMSNIYAWMLVGLALGWSSTGARGLRE